MTTITKGHDLLREVADLIERNPKAHDQGNWMHNEGSACGTTACIAGWATVLGTDDFYIRGGKYVPKKKAVMQKLRARFSSQADRDYYLDRMQGDHDIEARIDILDSANYYVQTGADLFGLSYDQGNYFGSDCWKLFGGSARPRGGHTVPSALRYIAKGGDIEDVWSD